MYVFPVGCGCKIVKYVNKPTALKGNKGKSGFGKQGVVEEV